MSRYFKSYTMLKINISLAPKPEDPIIELRSDIY